MNKSIGAKIDEMHEAIMRMRDVVRATPPKSGAPWLTALDIAKLFGLRRSEAKAMLKPHVWRGNVRAVVPPGEHENGRAVLYSGEDLAKLIKVTINGKECK